MTFWSRSRRAGVTGPPPASAGETGFGAAAFARLASRIDSALHLARSRGRGVIASVTVPLDAGIDPLAHIRGARSGGEHWSSFAQRARDDFALATLGVAAEVTAGGIDRFEIAAASCGAALEAAEFDDLFDDPHAPPGSGLAWVGGFSFFGDGPFADAWREAPALSLVLPKVSIVRRGGEHPAARMTIAVKVEPDAVTAREVESVEGIVDRLRLDEDFGAASFVSHAGAAETTSAAPPSHYERAVAQAAERIRAGEYEKIVLAREVVLRREREIDPFNAARGLADRFPECTVFALGREETTFLGASPELLIRREGRRASTIALAGSARRGADPETDQHLGEQLLADHKNREEHEIVVRRIERTLGRLSAWVAAGEAPELVRLKNIQHLATPIRAQLTEPRPAIQLAGLMHPTPAVGGEPWDVVADQIKALEGFDRGWYTGGVGWMDVLEDGEFHVALRSALIEGSTARLFVGAGIVGESVPEDELAETETKLQALLPVLSES